MAYSQQDRRAAFEAWYKTGQPPLERFARTYRTSRRQKISDFTIRQWRTADNWDVMAEDLNLSRARAVAEGLADERDAVIARHKQTGLFLQQQALKRLGEDGGGIQTEFGALTALRLGLDLESKAVGLSELDKMISDASDDQLTRLIEDLSQHLAKKNPEGFETETMKLLNESITDEGG